jgi:hypothetical protein
MRHVVLDCSFTHVGKCAMHNLPSNGRWYNGGEKLVVPVFLYMYSNKEFYSYLSEGKETFTQCIQILR